MESKTTKKYLKKKYIYIYKREGVKRKKEKKVADLSKERKNEKRKHFV